MILPKISIIDNLFSHAYSSSNWFKPLKFEWNFKTIEGEILFFTDNMAMEAKKYNKFKKYMWLVESPMITPKSYEYVNDNWQDYDKIFTHSKKLLQHPNANLLPIGGCHLDEIEISYEYEKNKLVSMMYSFKRFTTGHETRFQVANQLSQFIDIMGSGNTGVHLKKIHSCKNYAFSVVIENCKEDYYFTEKIIDCFLTGTIPIYWGCPSIGDFFNKKGFLTFDSVEELHEIIKNKQFLLDFYVENMPIIIENFDRAVNYKIAEDLLWKKYLNDDMIATNK